MSAGELTIVWTASEALFLGAEGRSVRQPLHPDDDRAEVVLEAWRTEFPEATAARLLTGDPADPRSAARLGALAADAGLQLSVASEPGGGRRRWLPPWPPLTSRARLILLSAAALALGWAGWQWRISRQSAWQRQSVAAELTAALAEDGRRQRESAEQQAVVTAACAVPLQYHDSLLHRLGDAPAALVLETVEFDGPDCRIRGEMVAGAPGAEPARAALQRSLFLSAEGWQLDPEVSSGAAFAWHATLPAPPPAGPSSSPPNAAAERARLPSPAQGADWRQAWALAWSVAPGGNEVRGGVQLQHFTLEALHRDARTWSELVHWVEQWHGQAGLSVDRLVLHGGPAHDGSLERASVALTVRIRIE